MSESGTGSTGQENEDLVEAVYTAVTSGAPDDKDRAIAALETTGSSSEEAETVYATAARLAEAAGTREAFEAILRGESEAPAEVSDAEVAAFGMNWGAGATAGVAGAGVGRPGAASSGGGAGPAGARKGTWEGNSGRTWEGTER